MSEFQGKPITCRAAVAWEPVKPFCIETVEVAPPKAHEVRIKITNTSVCRSDLAGLNGMTTWTIFPIILGHEGCGIVESVGEGVTSVQPGDHVIPMYVPQCNECYSCKTGLTNLCDAYADPKQPGAHLIPPTMLDGTTRFTCKGKAVYHFLGTATFSEYTVLPDIQVAKINPEAPLNKVCLIGCGIPTGYGSAVNTAKVRKGSTCVVMGLGAIGLAAVMGCRNSGATRIIGVDINPDKFPLAMKLGMTESLNPKDHDKPIQQVIIEKTNGGADYTFECIGTVETMRAGLEACHKGWGVAVLIGIAGPGKEISTSPLQLVGGRKWTGSLFGDFRGRDDLPKLVDAYMKKEIQVDEFITHTMPIEKINDAFDLLKSAKCIRTVLSF